MAAIEYPEAFKPFVGEPTMAERQTKRRRSTRRIWSFEQLPMPRVFMTGPRWRSAFDVKEIPIADIDPAAAKLHRPGRKLLIFSLEEEVRERVLEEIRPGVFAMWSAPLERLGI